MVRIFFTSLIECKKGKELNERNCASVYHSVQYAHHSHVTIFFFKAIILSVISQRHKNSNFYAL